MPTDILFLVLLLDFPADGRSTEHSSAGAVETADKESCLVLEDLEHVGIVSLANWLHNELAGLNHTTKEDECLG